MSIQLRQNAETLIRDVMGVRAEGVGGPRPDRSEDDAGRREAFFGFRFRAPGLARVENLRRTRELETSSAG